MDPTLWLIVPGEWLYDLVGNAPADGVDPDAAAVLLLGAVFWVIVFAVCRVAWDLRRPLARRFGRVAAPARAGLAEKARDLRVWIESWTPRAAWSVLWRAEAAHLIVYVLPQLAIAGAKLALFVLFLPFSVMSFADQTGPLARLEPLDRPVCWTFASWCATPLVDSNSAQIAFKLAWFALALVWIAAWHRRRLRRS
jgi:hypothetical protein